MRPVSRRDLVVVAAGLALAAWLLVRATYGSLPPLRWWLPVPLVLLAVAEALGARTLRVRLAAQRAARRSARGGETARTADPAAPLVRPVEPMLVARLAVLAQASAFVGAAFVGIWAGVLLHVGPAVSRLQAAGSDTVTAVVGVLCAAALTAAALWLESVCRVPPEERDEQRPGDGVRA